MILATSRCPACQEMLDLTPEDLWALATWCIAYGDNEAATWLMLREMGLLRKRRVRR